MKTILSRLPLSPANRFRLKLAVFVAAGLLALAYLAPLAATYLVGQDVLKARLESELACALGRPARLEGSVRLTMLPWMGLRAGPVVLADAPGFGDEPFARVEAMDIGFDLTALVRGKLAMDALGLESPAVRLTRLEDGRENWRELFGPGTAGPGLPLRGLRVTGARVVYADRQRGRTLTVNRLDLRTGRDRAFDFSLACEAVGAAPDMETKLTLMGKAVMDDARRHLFLDKARLAGAVAVPSAQPAFEQAGREPLRAVFSALLTLNTQSAALELAEIKVNGLDAQLEGTVNVADLGAETPALVSTVSARGRWDGQWAKVLGLDLARPDTGRPGEQPALRAPPSGEREPHARFDFSCGPGGWRIENLLAGDGLGQLKGGASFVEGEAFFDLAAAGFDAARWRLRGGGDPWPLLDVLRPARSVRGRLEARDMRLAGVRIAEMYAGIEGRNGELRAYPLSARTSEALFTGEVRLGLGAAGSSFAASAQVAALTAADPGEKLSLAAAQAQAQGELTPAGLTAHVQAKLGDPLQSWRAPGLPEDWDRLWRGVGAVTAKASLRLGSAPGGGDDSWSDWELSELDCKSAAGRVSGSLAGRSGRLEVDLAADRLELDRLLALAELTGREGGDFLRPVEGKVAVKKLVLKGLDVDDLTLAGQVTPRLLKLTTATASLGGGKVSATCDADDRDGRRSMAVQASLSGVQAHVLAQYLPAGMKFTGTLDGKVSAEAAGKAGQPLWRSLRAQADLTAASGQAAWGAEGGRAGSTWAFSRTTLSLKAVLRPPQAAAPGPESVVADLTGQVGAETLGVVKRARVEIHGQAGLDQNGRPLWYRQPKLETSLALGLPFGRGQAPAQCQAAGRFEADLDKGTFAYADVDLRLAGAGGKARLSGAPGQNGALALTGAVDLPGLNPRELAPALGFTVPAKAGPDTWRRASLSCEIAGGARDLRLTNLRATLDDSLATGGAVLVDGRPRLDLNVDVLDIDRLDPRDPQPGSAQKPEEPFPLETLRALDFEAKVRVIRLVKDGFAWGNAEIALSAHGGRVGMRQQSVRFYGGNYYLDFTGDARGPELRCGLELRITGAEAYPFLMDLGGIDTVTRGSVEFSLAVEGHGASEKALRRTLAGSAQLKLSDGKLLLRDGSSARPVQAQAPAQHGPRDAQTQAPPPPPGADVVGFGRLSGAFAIHNGMAVTRDVLLAGPEIVVRGEGVVNLADELIDLALTAKMQDGGEAPLRIHGALYDPKLDIDRSKVISDKILGLFKSVLTLPGNVFDRIRRF